MSTTPVRVPTGPLSHPAPVPRRYRFGFVVEYAVGHVTFANMLEAAVDADPEVEAEWFFLRSGAEDWVDRLPPFSRNDTLQKSLRTRRRVGRRRHHLDALLIHTQTAALLSWRMMDRLPTVISTDGTPGNIDELSRAYGHPVGSDREEAVKRRLIGAMMRRAAAIMPWSDWTARSVIDDYGVAPDRVRLIRPGIYPEDWAAGPDGAADYGIDGRARFLFVGGDFRRKGGATLLAALERLPGDWHLDVVTKSRVPDHPRIVVHDGINPGDRRLAELYREANAFVLPTEGDTYGWVILEAMAAGLPVVSTSVGAIPEIVEEGRTGFLVAPGDAAALAAVLKRLMASAELRARLGRAARADFLLRHNARTQLPAVLDLLKSVSAPARTLRI